MRGRTTDGSTVFGGTCLNAGCIPSKALLESSELYHRAQVEFATHGIGVGDLALDLATMQKRKAGIVSELSGGIGSLFKANNVTGLFGSRTPAARSEGAVHAARRRTRIARGRARDSRDGLDAGRIAVRAV